MLKVLTHIHAFCQHCMQTVLFLTNTFFIPCSTSNVDFLWWIDWYFRFTKLFYKSSRFNPKSYSTDKFVENCKALFRIIIGWSAILYLLSKCIPKGTYQIGLCIYISLFLSPFFNKITVSISFILSHLLSLYSELRRGHFFAIT